MAEEIVEEPTVIVDSLTDEENDALIESFLGTDNINDEDDMSTVEDSRDTVETEVSIEEEDTEVVPVDGTEEEEEEIPVVEETEPTEDKTTNVEKDTAIVKNEADEIQALKDEVYDLVFNKGVKAKGMPRTIRDIKHLETMLQIGLGANETNRKIRPYMKQLRSLEQAGIDVQDDDSLNFIVDVVNGDKDAIKELIFNKHNIDEEIISDWLNERSEGSSNDYVPKNHIIDDDTFAVREQLEQVSDSPHYETLSQFLSNSDDDGKSYIAANPQLIGLLHEDMNTGVFSKAIDEAQYRMDRGILPNQSVLGAYITVMQDQKFLDSLNKDLVTNENTTDTATPTKTNNKKVVSRKKKASTTKVTTKGVTESSNGKININKMSDDEFDKLFNSLDIDD